MLDARADYSICLVGDRVKNLTTASRRSLRVLGCRSRSEAERNDYYEMFGRDNGYTQGLKRDLPEVNRKGYILNGCGFL